MPPDMLIATLTFCVISVAAYAAAAVMESKVREDATMEVTRFRDSDAEACADMIERSFPPAKAIEYLEALYQIASNIEVYVARIDGKPLGVVIAERNWASYRIVTLCVRKRYRRLGIGRALLARLKCELFGHRQTIFATVHGDDALSMVFFNCCGFGYAGEIHSRTMLQYVQCDAPAFVSDDDPDEVIALRAAHCKRSRRA